MVYQTLKTELINNSATWEFRDCETDELVYYVTRGVYLDGKCYIRFGKIDGNNFIYDYTFPRICIKNWQELSDLLAKCLMDPGELDLSMIEEVECENKWDRLGDKLDAILTEFYKKQDVIM